MRLAIVLVASLLAAVSHAAEPRKYAVLSLIGDVMLISQWVPATGKRLDPNDKQYLAMSDGTFDKAALLATHGALKKLDSSAEPVLLFAQERSIYEAQNRLLDADGKTLELLDHVGGMLKGTNATHLILVTKYRHEARLPMADGTVGSGMLEGVGFYIDSSMQTILTQTREQGSGLLAPFAYFRVELIDLASRRVVSEQRVVAARTISIASSTADHAWNALTGAQKVRTLRDMVTQETARVIPALIAAAP